MMTSMLPGGNRFGLVKGIVCFVACLTILSGVGADQVSWAKDRKTKEKSDTSGQNVKYTKSPDALPALINLSNARKEMVNDINAQNTVYSRVVSDARSGSISQGATMDQIKSWYGEPVDVDDKNVEGVTKWIYKKVSKDIASKEKIYLVFDKDGKLMRWEEPK